MATRARKTFSIRSQPGFVTIAMLCFAMLYLPIATLVFFIWWVGRKGKRQTPPASV